MSENPDYFNRDDDDDVTTAKGLSEAHWKYVERNIKMMLDFAVKLIEQNYKDGMVHGVMHGIEIVKERKESC